jgi:hypothetical protein
MYSQRATRPSRLRLPMTFAFLLACAACGGQVPQTMTAPGLDPDLVARAVHEASALQASGKRVWCVPFARSASGIDIKGNAGTWWRQAVGRFERGHEPVPGAVMSFRASSAMPLGHVAVVSRIVSDREILIDHANWKRSKVTLGMSAIDVSEAGDWSAVRVESSPGNYGRINPVDGFIYATAPQG